MTPHGLLLYVQLIVNNILLDFIEKKKRNHQLVGSLLESNQNQNHSL